MTIRTIMVWLVGLPLTGIFFLLVAFSFFINPNGGLMHSIVALWGRILLSLAGIKVTVKGRENVPREGPVLFISNHQGAFDIPLLQAMLPREFRWIAKKSLFKIPVVGWTMSFAGYIAIDRDNAQGAYRSMEAAAEKIKNGTSVVVFPEGTRSHSDRLLPFKRGAFLLAEKSSCPIVPVAIKGASNIMKKGGIAVTPASVTIAIGAPVQTGGRGAKELLKITRLEIERLFNEA
ncbi:MAG: lysophospholipid acyltransferase family protein [Deltaproteobacteria bacterium]